MQAENSSQDLPLQGVFLWFSPANEFWLAGENHPLGGFDPAVCCGKHRLLRATATATATATAAAAAAGVAALVLAAEDPGPERQRRQPTEHGCFYLLATRRGRDTRTASARHGHGAPISKVGRNYQLTASDQVWQIVGPNLVAVILSTSQHRGTPRSKVPAGLFRSYSLHGSPTMSGLGCTRGL